MMTSAQIRQSFLDFFKSKQHTIVPSSSLMPDAPNLLFTNAGMNQFVPIFLGERKADVTRWANAVPSLDTRAADTQKCIRAGGKHNDLEDVGLDTYHHTFFEMLGNWSFGDYFKKEAIEWAWELITSEKWWGFPKERLYATVYKPGEGDPAAFDQEAYDIWAGIFQQAGLDPKVHIVFGNKKDNFWMMGDTGPCGPCSEIHVDLTPKGDIGGSLVNKGDARCIEIWNLVFIQFNANPDGTFSPLPAKHVDTGMGFERVTSIMQCTKGLTDFANAKISNYETDIFRPVFDQLEKMSAANGDPRIYTGTLPGEGGTGDSPVPVGDPPTGTGRATDLRTDAGLAADAASPSAGQVARRDGPVARATHFMPGAKYSRRHLPHFEKPWAIYHVTINTIVPRKLSPTACDIVFDCILYWRERRYQLVAACVMPDHAHFIIQPGVKGEDEAGSPVFWSLSEILHSIKSYSAKEVNKLEGVKGSLWQEERYDRYMRSDADLQEKFHYVCRNPWAAELVQESEPWPWLWTPDIEAWKPYVPLTLRQGGTGDSPVPVGDPPTGTGRATDLRTDAGLAADAASPSAGQVARRDGPVARATQVQIDVAFRVIADHIRTLSFAIADGIQPGNNDRNYVLRRILRRAVRYGRTLGFHKPFFYELVDVLAETMGDVFPEIRARKKQVQDVIRVEEEAFNKTLDEGIEVFESMLKRRIELNEATTTCSPQIEAFHARASLAFAQGRPLKLFLASEHSVLSKLYDETYRLNHQDFFKFFGREPGHAATLAKHLKRFGSGSETLGEVVAGTDEFAWKNVIDFATDLSVTTRGQIAHNAAFPGRAAFVLYDTYGFPLDLTELMARERGLTVDVAGFNKLMDEQKARARAAQKKQVIELSQIESTTPTAFVGYEKLETPAKVVEVVELKDKTAVILDTSACYAEMGGQVGDTGEILLSPVAADVSRLTSSIGADSRPLLRVVNTQKTGNTWLHLVEGEAVLAIGDEIILSVDQPRRRAIERHHTVTHIFHWALHEVVNRDATQKGSFVGPEKLTFDFNCAPLTPQQLADIEKLVNERILENSVVSWTEVPYTAVRSRADVMQLFGEKYGDTVRVVQIGGGAGGLNGYSMELCGGTHTRHTGEIGLFRLVSESAIAAGVRRVEAIAGLEAWRRAGEELEALKRISGRVNSPLNEVEKKIEAMLAHQKELEKALKAANQREAAQSAKSLIATAETIKGVQVIAKNLGEADGDTLQTVADALKGDFKGIVVLGGLSNGAVALVATVSPELTKQFQAGKIIQAIAPIVGGKGGGRPDNARGGGKDAGKLDEALAKAKSLLG